MARGKLRRIYHWGLNLPYLQVGSVNDPHLPAISMTPMAANPTQTQEEGDIWWLDSDNAPSYYDGSAKQTIPGLARANTWTVAQTFSVPPAGGMQLRPIKTAAATLNGTTDNGALCVFNSAAGDIYTLPTAAAGLWYEFRVVVTATSNNQKIITASGSEFLLGTFVQSTDGTYTSALQSANGSTIRAWTGNGTTTGGIKGDWFKITAISATQWVIEGMGSATGSEATPFATS